MPDTQQNQTNYRYSDSYMQEAERRLNTLTIETATLREKSLNSDRVLARIEIVLSETQATLAKLNEFNASSTLSIEKLVDAKIAPIQMELAARKEEIVKLKTTITVVASIASAVMLFIEVFHDHLISFFTKG